MCDAHRMRLSERDILNHISLVWAWVWVVCVGSLKALEVCVLSKLPKPPHRCLRRGWAAWPWGCGPGAHGHGPCMPMAAGGGAACAVSLCVVFCLAYLSREADAGFLLIHKAP